MPKLVSMFIVNLCFLLFGSAAGAQLLVDEQHKLTRLVDQHFLLAFVDRHLTIVENSSSLLLLGAMNVTAAGKNFLGLVKAHEFIATGQTVVGMAITDRVHMYNGNSAALIAIGGLGEAPDGVNGITSVEDKSRVGLAVGDVAFVKDEARIGVVIGDVSFVSDQARIGLVVGKISHKAQKDSVFLQIYDGKILVKSQDLFKNLTVIPGRPDSPASWPDDEAWPHWQTFSF